MKPTIITVFLGLALVSMISCEKKSESERTIEKVEKKVDDALDRRPAEKVQDAAEKAADKVNDALDRRPGEAVKDAAEDAADKAKDVTN